jgi:hypothetical protein
VKNTYNLGGWGKVELVVVPRNPQWLSTVTFFGTVTFERGESDEE